jgi:HK97 gp10 family phage protein
MVEVNIKGLRELNAALNQLPKNIAKNVLRGAIGKGLRLMKNAAIQNAPEMSAADAPKNKDGQPKNMPGTLKRAIAMRRLARESSAEREYWILYVRRGSRFLKDSGKKAGGVEHYGPRDAYYAKWVEFGTSKMSARSFMRPAFEQTKTQTYEAAVDYIRKRLPLEIEKLRKQ